MDLPIARGSHRYCGMHIARRSDHLEFYGDVVLDQQVGGRFSSNHVVARDDDFPPLDDAEPGLGHLVGQGISETLSKNP